MALCAIGFGYKPQKHFVLCITVELAVKLRMLPDLIRTCRNSSDTICQSNAGAKASECILYFKNEMFYD